MSDYNTRSGSPTVGDGYVKEKLEALDKVFALHQKLDEAGAEPPDFYPEEITGYLDFEQLETAWKFRSYGILKKAYVVAWIEYVTDVTGEPTYYTADDFLSN